VIAVISAGVGLYIYIYTIYSFVSTNTVMESNRPAGEMGHLKRRWYQISGQGLTPKKKKKGTLIKD
jgi:hypothetical protein